MAGILHLVVTFIAVSLNFHAISTQISVDSAKDKRVLLFPYSFGYSSHIMDFQNIALMLMTDGFTVSVLTTTADGDYFEAGIGRQKKRGRVFTFPPSRDPSTVRLSDSKFKEMMFELSTKSGLFQAIGLMHIVADQQYGQCKELMRSTSILNEIKFEEYDLIIVDFVDVCARLFIQYLNIPAVVYSGVGLTFDPALFPGLPSFVPMFMSQYSDEMTFSQRLDNTIRKMIAEYTIDPYWFDRMDELRKEFFDPTGFPPLKRELTRHLFLSHSSWVLDFPRPLFPNVVLVGGMHATKPSPLKDNDLEDWIMEDDDEGIVVVSFGSLVGKARNKTTDEILNALLQLKQRVVWRHTGTLPEGVNNSNVLVKNWIPQNDLLGHKKTKLFVTHCGVHGMYEAVYNKVPVVAVPIFGDQVENAIKLVQRAKMGVFVEFANLTSESLLAAINTVLENKIYKENAEKAYDGMFNSSRISPVDNFLFHVNYALKNRGVEKLISKPLRQLEEYQMLNYDIVFIIVVFGFVVTLLGLLFTCLFCKCFYKFVVRRVILRKDKTD